MRCCSILLSRLQGEKPGNNLDFVEVREQLNAYVKKTPQDARLLSLLAVVDALLNNKETAVSEGRRAVQMLPVAKDAIAGAAAPLKNLAMVYTWSEDLDQAFDLLSSLSKNAIRYLLCRAKARALLGATAQRSAL